MFFYKLNSWADRVDPYWYSRLMGLKLAYLSIVVFIANLLLHPPLAPLIMLIAGAGVFLIEMPTINKPAQKDNLYLVYIILISLTIGLFSSYVYLGGVFIVVAAGWCYILYHAVKSKPELFPMVSVILMLGIMALEGFNSGNFYIIANIVLFIFEFGLIVFWAHKLFPNLYHLVWLSATIRSLETSQLMLRKLSVVNSPQAFRHNQAASNVLGLLLTKPYLAEAATFSNYLGYYHYYLSHLIENTALMSSELQIIANDLYLLEQAIRRRQPLVSPLLHLTMPEQLAGHYELFPKLYLSWNKICAPANS